MGSVPTSQGTTEERYSEPFTIGITSTGVSGSQGTLTAVGSNSTNSYIVVRNITFSMTPAVAGTLLNSTNVTLNLINGPSGGANLLWTAIVAITSTGLLPLSINLPFIRASKATNVTAEFSAGVTGAIQAVSMAYFSGK